MISSSAATSSCSTATATAQHLQIARAANPATTLLVNDYRVEPAYYEILDSLRVNGGLQFDAVGIQTVKFYTALFAHPAVEAITWWDFSDHGAWQRAPAGWLRRDMSPKPVYEQLLKCIQGEWWTKIETQPNALGHAPLRAFCGKHRVTVTLPSGFEVDRDIHLQRGKATRFELTVA